MAEIKNTFDENINKLSEGEIQNMVNLKREIKKWKLTKDSLNFSPEELQEIIKTFEENRDAYLKRCKNEESKQKIQNLFDTIIWFVKNPSSYKKPEKTWKDINLTTEKTDLEKNSKGVLPSSLERKTQEKWWENKINKNEKEISISSPEEAEKIAKELSARWELLKPLDQVIPTQNTYVEKPAQAAQIPETAQNQSYENPNSIPPLQERDLTDEKQSIPQNPKNLQNIDSQNLERWISETISKNIINAKSFPITNLSYSTEIQAIAHKKWISLPQVIWFDKHSWELVLGQRYIIDANFKIRNTGPKKLDLGLFKIELSWTKNKWYSYSDTIIRDIQLKWNKFLIIWDINGKTEKRTLDKKTFSYIITQCIVDWNINFQSKDFELKINKKH